MHIRTHTHAPIHAHTHAHACAHPCVQVLDGGVRSPDAKTAVHRRKVASYY